MNILAVGAHPDDIEFGCYGTLALHRRKGDKIFGVIITRGELSGDPEKRYKESREAAKLIGMKLVLGDFPDGKLKLDSCLITFLDKIIEESKISIVYSHTTHDRHQDHRIVAQACISASRNINELYSYETPSVIYPFNPQLFIDVTDFFQTKITAKKKFN